MSTTLANPLQLGLRPARQRTAQDSNAVALPADVRLVSADTHWEHTQDIYFERFPEEYRDRAPRVWFDRIWKVGYPENGTADQAARDLAERYAKMLDIVIAPGTWDFDIRNYDLDAEGVEKEIVYPSSLLQFVRHPDLKIQELIYSTYNEHTAEVQRASSGRFYGVGVCSNWWDPAQVEQAVRQVVDLELRALMVPTVNPGKTADGQPISYGGKEMDRFWSAVAEANIPVTFHVGENFSLNSRDSFATSVIVSMGSFRKPFSELVFGGVFDRHPDLRVVFAEGGIGWVPCTLQDCEATIDSHRAALDYVPKSRPSDYWHQNCYATFQNDVFGLKLIDYIGADRIMWANDYPHNEGTFGYGRSSAQTVLDHLSPDDAKKVLGGNAIALYRLDDN